jgi:hypothetical protein
MEIFHPALVRLAYHESAISKVLQPLPCITQRVLRGFGRLTRGVMRRFERVVALPNPKILKLIEPHQQLRVSRMKFHVQ